MSRSRHQKAPARDDGKGVRFILPERPGGCCAQNEPDPFSAPDLSAPAAGQPGGVSLDVLCRRAERLIDSVRMMGEQVDRMFARPDHAVAEANATARSLTELREGVEAAVADARRAEESCSTRIADLQNLLPTIQNSAEGLIQRVMRARELSEVFGKLMDSAADRIAGIEAASDEARKARQAIANALDELARMQKTADNWAESVRRLSAKQAEFIATGNGVANRLRTLSDAGDRLRETVRQDIVSLRELLRESRLERLAWEKLLARMPDDLPKAPGAASDTPTASVPAALAQRVRQLSDYIRQAANAPASLPESYDAPAPLRSPVARHEVFETTGGAKPR